MSYYSSYNRGIRNRIGRLPVSNYDMPDIPRYEAPTLDRARVYAHGRRTVEETEKPEASGALRVRDVDYRIQDNARHHHTEMYELTRQRPAFDGRGWADPQLVLRRGFPCDIDVEFDRAFDDKHDDIRIVLETGPRPLESKGTKVELMLSDTDIPRHWGAKVLQTLSNNKIRIRLFIPPNCLVSKWTLNMDTVVKSGSSHKTFRYKAESPIYIILNPWCNDDTVFIPNDSERHEYVLADTGRIYRGTTKQISYCTWNFGQFEDFVLELIMWLLDHSGMNFQARGNPVLLARKISALVNSPDDSGILVGNWSGEYSAGTSPMAWQGSVRILEQFWKTKEPVKFGQCWVFSGVTTSVCRALGLPARSVTNFSSAHDSDGSITIDCHWDVNGKPLDEYNKDSVWNFHVWNEVWMARPDLVHDFGGWQAIDATPQETSEGVYCAGPASIEALKQGLVHLPYDGGFIFAEVNADRVHWILKPEGGWTHTKQKHKIGKSISTKKVNSDEREDVTWMYKYPEGSPEERAAVHRANKEGSRGHISDLYHHGREDVKLDLINKEEAQMGQPFTVDLTATNTSQFERTVSATLTATVIYYTGVPVGEVKSEMFEFPLKPKPGYTETVRMTVEPKDYLDRLVDMCHIKIRCMAQVKETQQAFCEEDDFRLTKPDLDMKVPYEVREGQDFEIVASFTNPIPRSLTKCYYTLESPQLKRPIKVDHKPVGPSAKVEFKERIKATAPGTFTILMSFDAKEISDVKGAAKITVMPKA